MNNSLKKWLIISVIINIVLLVTATSSLTLLISSKSQSSSSSIDGYETTEYPIKGIFICTQDNIIVKQEPSANADKLGLLQEGDEVAVVLYYGDWAKIKYTDVYGYVSFKYLEEKKTE